MAVYSNLPSLQLSLSDKKLMEIIRVGNVKCTCTVTCYYFFPQIGLSIPVPPSITEADPNAVTVKGKDVM